MVTCKTKMYVIVIVTVVMAVSGDSNGNDSCCGNDTKEIN